MIPLFRFALLGLSCLLIPGKFVQASGGESPGTGEDTMTWQIEKENWKIAHDSDGELIECDDHLQTLGVRRYQGKLINRDGGEETEETIVVERWLIRDDYTREKIQEELTALLPSESPPHEHPNLIWVLGATRSAKFINVIYPALPALSLAKVLYPDQEGAGAGLALENREGIEWDKDRIAREKERVAWEIANALEYLHRVKLPHGRLTPGTVLLDDQLRVKLFDFGRYESLAFPEGYYTIKDDDPGNAAYLAPEYWTEEFRDGNAAMAALDICAWAIITNEMFAGQLPFPGRQPASPKGQRPALAEDMPDKLRDLIQRSWAEDPKDRLSIQEIVASS